MFTNHNLYDFHKISVYITLLGFQIPNWGPNSQVPSPTHYTLNRITRDQIK